MRILVLAPFFPFPLDQGGKIRIFNLIKHLSIKHEVTLAATVDDPELYEAGPLSAFCKEIILVRRPARLWPDRLAFFTSNQGYNVIRYRSRELRRILQQRHRERSYDLVQVEFSMMWQYADIFNGTPVVLDAHNIEHQNVGQIGASAKSTLWRLLYRIEEARLRKMEERAWRECALLFTVSDQEREEIAARTGKVGSVITAANGVDTERFKFTSEGRGGKRILFLGGMDYSPNQDAARHFLEKIFPQVLLHVPDATLHMVGRELGRLGDLSRHPGVVCHESVPDVLPWFYDTDLLVVPLRQGAGTRIKVLEAMAAGLPIVSTSKGCEGIAASNGEELLVANAPEEFASAILRIMREKGLGSDLTVKARFLIQEKYTWKAAAEIIDKAYMKSGWSQIRSYS